MKFFCLLSLLLGLFCFSQDWDWPKKSENLKVLPKDTSAEALREAMRHYSTSLGVRCNECHVGEDNKPFSSYDFASDKPKKKEITREMIRMVDQINASIAKIPGGHAKPLKVTCMTCHRGVEEPKPLEDVLLASYRMGGKQRAAERYQKLREKYYGGFSYDFRELPLYQVAKKLVDEGKEADALSFLELNLKHNPESGASLHLQGDLLLKKGETQAALAAWKKALEYQNWNQQIKEKIAAAEKTLQQPEK